MSESMLDKWAKVSDEVRAIYEFLESKGDEWFECPMNGKTQLQLIYEHFGIDGGQLEKERRALYSQKG